MMQDMNEQTSLQMNEEKIYCYIKQQEELNDEEDINKLLLQKISVPIVPYGQSTYEGHSFPNCVENTILQLLKILSWKDGIYKIDLLPLNTGRGIVGSDKKVEGDHL